MKVRLTVIALILSAPFAPAVFAQSVGSAVQRDINQETRIEQGLQSGQLSTGSRAAGTGPGPCRSDRSTRGSG